MTKKLGQKGQSIMEYIILTGLIGLFCLFSIQKFGEQIERKIESAHKRINKTIKIK